jgi:peptide deformylase
VYFQRNFRLSIYGPETNNVLSRPVEEAEWPDIPRLFEYMFEVMRKAEGLGLVASQIGCFKRFMLIESKRGVVIGLINPEITRLYGEEVRGLEWCSNVPPQGNECAVPRMDKVDIEASLAGSPDIRMKFKFSGSLARTVQHGIDHMDGIFFVDRIQEEHKKIAVLKKFNEWKSMRRAQIRTMEESGNVNTGAFAVSRGQSRVS